MISTFTGIAGKRSRLNALIIAGSLASVLCLIFLLDGLHTEVPLSDGEAGTAVSQALPNVDVSQVSGAASPPAEWLQASGSQSGNAAWSDAVVAPFDTLWILSTGRELFAPPAIVGSMIFIAGNDNVLRGIEIASGRQIWSRTVTCGVSGGVAADSSTVYFSGQDGYMYALDFETGAEKWKTGLGYHIFTDANVFCDSLVLAGNSMGSLAALCRNTGELIWEDTMEGLVLGPALSDSIAVFSSEAGAVGAWDSEGNSLWSRDFSSQPSAPSIQTNSVYLGFSSGKILALSLSTGETLWETSLDGIQGRTVISRPAMCGNGLLVAGTCDGRVFCLDAERGELLWETQLENWVSVTPAVCEDVVYVSCDDNRIHLLSLITGLPIDSIETGSYSGTPPLLIGGVLYVGNSAGDFLALAGTLPVNP
jgi:outer membrane protein assembly factor BamB